jgi:hypothetical protein
VYDPYNVAAPQGQSDCGCHKENFRVTLLWIDI